MDISESATDSTPQNIAGFSYFYPSQQCCILKVDVPHKEMFMRNNRVSKKSIKRLFGLPAVRKHLDIPPGTHDIGGDGFDDQRPYLQKRVDAVTRACVQALR